MRRERRQWRILGQRLDGRPLDVRIAIGWDRTARTTTVGGFVRSVRVIGHRADAFAENPEDGDRIARVRQGIRGVPTDWRVVGRVEPLDPCRDGHQEPGDALHVAEPWQVGIRPQHDRPPGEHAKDNSVRDRRGTRDRGQGVGTRAEQCVCRPLSLDQYHPLVERPRGDPLGPIEGQGRDRDATEARPTIGGEPAEGLGTIGAVAPPVGRDQDARRIADVVIRRTGHPGLWWRGRCLSVVRYEQVREQHAERGDHRVGITACEAVEQHPPVVSDGPGQARGGILVRRAAGLPLTVGEGPGPGQGLQRG